MKIKKTIVRSIVILMFLIIPIGSAYACDGSFTITDELGIDKLNFGFDETPWLKINLNSTDAGITGWWKQQCSTGHDISENNITMGSTITRPLTKWNWPTSAEAGTYQVKLYGYAAQSFTVTPEPVSSILFLIGGASLVGFRRRKKKLIAV